MRPNDRGTESRLGMGHRGLDEEGEKEHHRQKEQRVQKPGGEQWQVGAGVGKGQDDTGSGLRDNEVWALNSLVRIRFAFLSFFDCTWS